MKNLIKKWWKVTVQVHRDRAAGMLEAELKELENIFMVLLLGSLVGLPSPPVALTFELLPFLEEELILMVRRADASIDPLGMLGVLKLE